MGGVLLIAVPFHVKGVLLFAIYLTGFGTPAFVLALSWCAGSNAGHTKKTTTNAMLLIGYCEYSSRAMPHRLANDPSRASLTIGVGNLVSPQIWQAQYAPRYYVPWGIILATWFICPFLLYVEISRISVMCLGLAAAADPSLTVRYFLKKENDRRDKLMADPNYVHERYFDEDSQEIDSTFMDITDVSWGVPRGGQGG